MRFLPPRGWCLSTSRIERVRTLEPTELDGLVARSLEEGFRFMQRLRDEYISGANRFERPGEALLMARASQTVIAVIGLNLDPHRQPGVMRVRRFYVLPEHRGAGLGQKMLLEVIELSRIANAKMLELSTDNPRVSRFYQQHGFEVVRAEHATHRLSLGFEARSTRG
jgi:GNAT superfamily N-acetyltransferase